MAIAAHDQFPKHGLLDRVKNLPRNAKVVGALALAALSVVGGNALKPDASSSTSDRAVPTLTGDGPKSPATFGVGEKQELADTTTTQAAAPNPPKPAVAKPKPETRPTQPTQTTVERDAGALEKAEALGRASTVQILFHSKETNNTSYETAAEGGSATHIGGGWVMFNKHQLGGGRLGADGPKQGGPYDAASSSPYKFTIWNGSGPGQMSKAGALEGIIVNGSDNQPDFALGYAPEAANMPAMQLAKEAPNTAGEYFIGGYPSEANGQQKQYPVKFLAEGKVDDIRYKGDPYPTDNNIRLYYFGIDKSVPVAEKTWDGISGGLAGNSAGEAYGGLMGYGKPPEPGKSGDPIWYGANKYNPEDTENSQVVFAIQVVDQPMVDSHQAKLGQPNP